MAPFNAFMASYGFTESPTFTSGLSQFVTDRNLVLAFLHKHWDAFIAWLHGPAVWTFVIAWAITFTVIIVLLLGLGFGPAGVVAGSAAAAFQGWMYGGFTPAAGVFATLTSLGMLGILNLPLALVSAGLATIVATIVVSCGAGISG